MSDRMLRNALKNFNFTEAFVEIGWNYLDQRPPGVEIGEHLYTLKPIAEKKGVQVFDVSPDAMGLIPPRDVRRKIDRKVAGYAEERLLIFTNGARTKQVWLWVDRAPGKAPSYREHEWHTSQDPEGIVQKLNQLAFAIEEEDTLTVVDVAAKMEQAFDKEKVTKKFYREFDRYRKTFLGQISGIPDPSLKEWYASALLNRLMFVYFLQRKGFLDGDRDYLRNRLDRCQREFGDDEFYSFYRTFLLKLFHDGLGAPENRREAALRALIGKVPYLNGGLFQIHDIERDFPDIQVPDDAFVALFDFFDTWDWTLDYRPLRDGKEINPDVLGYLFEQYINNKQMGAYYTKEDITGYITRNTLLPFVLDEARRQYPAGFKGEQSVWRLLQQDPDAYIYPSVQHTARDEQGHPRPLPEKIAAGLDDVAERGAWNTLTPPTWGLPTEIWRETVARRQRYENLRAKLAAGAVHQTADLVSLNLDIEQFTKDAIETCEDPALLRVIWKALRTVTVLDPTCGSGAFLFAALERLEVLYTACLHRMQEFVGRLDTDPNANPQALSDFRAELKEAYDKGKHPNLTYFVLKRILLDNLYGVDIMPEAVEICKLRLFLKLAAQVESGGRLEPLPDIDFNIRAGNALVGYASREEVQRGLTASRVAGGADQGELVFGERADALAEFEERLRDVAELAGRFREQQQTYGGEVTAEDKEALRSRLRALADQLDRALALSYGIDPDREEDFDTWRESHQPFHWFAEFYGVMNEGGFDVVIGNPPYVAYSKVQNTYRVDGYLSIDGRNLFVYTLERTLHLISRMGSSGIITPISLVSIDNTESVRRLLLRFFNKSWFSHFAIRPAKLFEGVEQRLTIFIGVYSRQEANNQSSTKYYQWYVDERLHLFETLQYDDVKSLKKLISIPKTGNSIARRIIGKVDNTYSAPVQNMLSNNNDEFILYFHRTPGYWIRVMDFEPYFRSPTHTRSIHHIRELKFKNPRHSKFVGAILNSSLYFFYFFATGNCRNLTSSDIKKLRVGMASAEILAEVGELFDALMKNFNANSTIKSRGITEFQEFNWTAAKPIIDEIDTVLAKHYGFTDEELDFIINYDIKYRLGLESFAKEEVEA